MQTRRMSLVESLANVAVGYVVALAAQLVILPQYGCHLALRDNMAIGGLFTVVSIARSYLLRRAFNAMKGNA